MSEDPHPAPASGSDAAAAPRARKTTAKKAAKKTAAKKAAKKVAQAVEAPAPAPEPTAPARKAAKKAAAKKAAKRPKAADEQPQLPFEAPAPAPTRDAPAAEISTVYERPEGKGRSKPGRRDEEPGEGARFGRVPGGGRVARDRPAPAENSAPPAPREHAAPADRPPARESQEPRQHREPREPGDHPGSRDSGQPRHGGEPRPGGEHGQGDFRERKKRRRKRRRDRRDREGGERQGAEAPHQGENAQRPRHERGDGHEQEHRPHTPVLQGPKIAVSGLFELAPKGFGFLRVPEKRFEQARDDVFVSPEIIRQAGLRLGHWVTGFSQEGPRGPQLVEITDINGLEPAESKKLPAFEELKAINPGKRISFETDPNRFTTRVVDLMSPVGRGQRGLIVSPPRSGKTTLMLHMAEAVRELHDETLHLMILLVDERPEEVTEFRRCLPGAEIYASSNDEHPRNHARLAELCIERAKRLVEAGKHVFLLMDSITRLARAYNNSMGGGRGRGIGSGGIMVGALEVPRRLFAAARNTREGGSLTILATALVQTNSRADEAIFQEFKGTGNMELVLDRKIAENYLYPAVDIFKSGTRREELLLPEHTLHKIHMIRRGLSGHRPVEAMERLLFFLKKFPNNPQMLLEIKG